ncbi:VOC family protein [Martelella sp. HB161492]|uniref:VOC family protein n=1 Tax=Martelella sp. HB161492 TaxID=2720726 RepID=UPI0015911063|nr:VOC family protein [Martelella sp. HB161492]
MTIRGIEHIGITVPDHGEAVAFFAEAFGAEVLFSLTDKTKAPLKGTDLAAKNGLNAKAAIVAVSMLRLANGANIEIFEIDHPGRPGGGNIADIGISHFSINVDDIDAAAARFARAGGTLMEGPYGLTGQEEGPGNLGRFGLTPWGLLIEFESFSSPMNYDPGTAAERWLPDSDEDK